MGLSKGYPAVGHAGLSQIAPLRLAPSLAVSVSLLA
jgi:hypothetical protein